MEKQEVGKITHYFSKIGVAVVQLSGTLKVGERILIEGSDTGPVEQTVDSMQIEHKDVPEAGDGQSVGMKVNGKVHPGNTVYTFSD
ncbi:MAG: EF-Tu/IF-2/RF-3 family GTPase [Candidatus Micrarchaeota archaeon]